jgi:hypothetical protein
VSDAFGAQEAAVEARTGFGDVENFQEQILEALVAADRAPLDLVLIYVASKPRSSLTRP